MVQYPFDDLPDNALIRLPQVMALCGLRRSRVYDLAAKGGFPRPQKISSRASAWRAGEVRRWLQNPLAWRAEPLNS